MMEGWDEIWMARDGRVDAGIDGFVLNQGEASSRRRRSADASGRLPAASVGRALAGATPLRRPRDGGIGHRGWAMDKFRSCDVCVLVAKLSRLHVRHCTEPIPACLSQAGRPWSESFTGGAAPRALGCYYPPPAR